MKWNQLKDNCSNPTKKKTELEQWEANIGGTTKAAE